MLYKKIKKRIIQFVAGNIGRSFIGQLFSRSGYLPSRVVFEPEDNYTNYWN
jgi:mannitol-1-phosphate/altronate dehydrogenase